MSGLFSGPKIPQAQPAQIQAQKVEEDAANASLFERLRRMGAMGKQQTMLTAGKMIKDPATERKTLLGLN